MDLENLAARAKWREEEDDDEDVKDNWDDEDEEPPKPPPVETKKITLTAKGKNKATGGKDNPTTDASGKPLTAKELEKLQKESDLKLTKQMLGVEDKDIELEFQLNTKEDFDRFHKNLVHKLWCYDKSPHYFLLLDRLFRDLCVPLEADELKTLSATVNALFNEKVKVNKNKPKKKAIKGLAIKVERNNLDRNDYADELDDIINCAINFKPVMLRIISSAIGVAARAGAEVRQITKTGKLGIVEKGVQDYQTEADRRAQRMIVVSLASKFPKSTIVGEEDLVDDKKADASLLVEDYDENVLKQTLPKEYEGIKEEDVTIWVDPLDGTSEFVKGVSYEHVTVLIGISVNGKSVAGIMNQPFYGQTENKEESATGRTMWGLVGLGCFGVNPRSMPEDNLVITTTASHGNENIDNSIASLKPDKVLKVGGAGHKVLLVIEGKAHAYVFASAGCKRWDTSAPEAILRSAGGELTDAFGQIIEYKYRSDRNYQNYFGVVASINHKIHSRVIESIPQKVKDSLRSKSKL